jgi:integrase
MLHTESVQHEVLQWVLDGRKFLSDEEIKRLKRSCQQPRDLLIINLGLLTGLRVKEVADLRCGDISLGIEISSLTVRHGKGGKSRLVRFSARGGPAFGGNGELKESIMNYLKYKEAKGEETGTDDPLFSAIPARHMAGGGGSAIGGKSDLPAGQAGKNGKHISRRTIQRVFERVARRAGISGHSFHHLRHTYASHLYRASGYNLRLVQKQLGHSSIKTTQVYADVFDEDLTKAVEKLYI